LKSKKRFYLPLRVHSFCGIGRLFFLFAILLLASSADKTAHALEINIWDYPRWLEPGEKVDRFAWMKKQLKTFEMQNPNIKVKLTELTWNRGDEKLKIAALGGSHPDIAPGTVPLLFIKEGLIEPVDEYLDAGDRDDYLPGAVNAYTVGGKIYGWPWYMGGQLLFLNRSIFASAGVELPASGRWNHSDFTDKLRRLKKHLSDKNGSFPLGFYFEKNETANFPFLFGFGGDWVDSRLSFLGNSSETIAGLEWLKGLVKDGLAPSDSGGRKSNDIWTAFARENRVAVGAFGLWAVKALIEKFPMDFEIVHFPADEGKTARAFLGISGLYVFHSDDTARVKAAMKLARFLTSAELQKDLCRYTQFPTRKSTGNIYPGNRHMTRAWEVLQEGRTVLPDARWPQIDEEIETEIQSVLLDRTGSREAMDRASKRVQAILERQNGSISDDLRRGSFFGKLFLYSFPIFLLLLIISKQTHLILIVPALTVLGLFLYYPLADALILAFRNYRIGEVGDFTFANFTAAFYDRKFQAACLNTVIYTIIVVPANVLTALVASSLIYSLPAKFKGFYRAMYYLPGVASVVVLSMAWRWLFNTEVGLFNSILRSINLPAVGWLSNPDIALTSVILTGVLRSPGGAILVYLAALANIPKSIYESAEIEGADPIQKWLYVTVPLLKGTTMFLLVTGTIDALQVFAQVLMLTDGGPGTATTVIVHRIYTAAFRDFDFGVSSAMATVLFIGILVVTIFQRKFSGNEVEELA